MQQTQSAIATPAEVAAFLRSSTERLAKQRVSGDGPKFVKDGQRVIYRWDDVYTWIDDNTREKTSGTGR